MLKVESLSFEIQGKSILDDINLQFEPGFIYGVVGPNGSGKTTLLKTLNGVWKAKGKVFWRELDLLSQDRQTISRILSFVPQNPPVPFDFTVEEIVEMGTYPRTELRLQKRKELTEWALTLVDAWHLRDRKATSISHGERQRMYIARSLVTKTPVLMLDEPTSNLDIRHQIDIWKLLQVLAKNENKIIIVTNHDLVAIERYCEKIVVLSQGKCLARGFLSETLTPSLVSSVFDVQAIPGQGKIYH